MSSQRTTLSPAPIKRGKGWRWAGGLALAVIMAAGAQADTFPSDRSLSVENQYLRVHLRQHYINVTLDTSTDPPTRVVDVFRGGRFLIETTGGDPLTDQDNNKVILGAPPRSSSSWTSYATVHIVGVDLDGDGTNDIDNADYEIETLMGEWDDPNQDLTMRNENAGSRDLDYAWQIPINDQLPVTTSVLSPSATTTPGGSQPQDPRNYILVEQRATLMRDAVRFEYRLTNRSSYNGIEIGLRIFLDPSFDNQFTPNDGQAIEAQNVEGLIRRESIFPDPTQTYKRRPTRWISFDDVTQPATILRGILDGEDVSTADYAQGPPDQVIFGQARLMFAVPWDYIPAGNRLVNEDVGISLRWAPQPFRINESRTYVTYFGLGGSTSIYQRPYVGAVQAPFSLQVLSGDDPRTPAVEPDTHTYLNPTPFTITAYAANVSDRPINNVVFSLSLPEGLELADPQEARSKSIGAVGVDGEGSVSWKVQPVAGMLPGPQEFVVSASGLGVPGRVLERRIEIPALPLLTFPSPARQIDLISIPYDFNNRDYQHILEALGSLGVGGNAAVARWNPQDRQYHFFPDSFVTNLQAGEGFWLFNGNLRDLTLPEDRFEVPTTQTVAVPLEEGWNQIGNPFVFSTRWSDAQVATPDGNVHTVAEAAEQDLLRSTLYWYVPNEADPSSVGRYEFAGGAAAQLLPWRGYWVRALRSGLVLLLNASRVVGPYRSPGGLLGGVPSPEDGWQMRLEARIGSVRSTPQYLGVSARASDGYDHQDWESPPPPGLKNNIWIGFDHGNWGLNRGRYVRDIRAPVTTPKVWEVNVATDIPEADVTLTWDLRHVPADYRLTLIDRESGITRSMRAASSYTFRSGPAGASRTLAIQVERVRSTPLVITDVRIQARRATGTPIAFTVNRSARARVQIFSLSGRLVRTVTADQEARAGTSVVVWDERSEEGHPLPPGLYLCKVQVWTEEAERVETVRALPLTP